MSCKYFMIVSVWLSHVSNPAKKVRYHIQSDTTFILDKLCDILEIDGPSMDLLVSTITLEKQSVYSRRYGGFIVKGYVT